MAQDYSFTFQNLNPAQSGWSASTIANPAATNLYSNPLDLVDPEQAVNDKTANNSTGLGIDPTNGQQTLDLMTRNAALITNLQKRAKTAESADMLNQVNQEIFKAQAEQDRLQTFADRFGVTYKGVNPGKKKDNKLVDYALLAASGGVSALAKKDPVINFLSGLFGGKAPPTKEQIARNLAQQVINQETKSEKERIDLESRRQSVEALQEAVANTTDPHTLKSLNTKLNTAQVQLNAKQKVHDATTAHIDGVKAKILKASPGTGATTAPAAVPLTPEQKAAADKAAADKAAADAAGAVISPSHPIATTQPNYWNDLVDKGLGSRAGASGWHSAGIPMTGVTTAAPGTVLAPTAEAPVVPEVAPTPVRALTEQELKWRAAFDPRGWANSLGIPTPITPAKDAILTAAAAAAGNATALANPLVTAANPVTQPGASGVPSFGGGWT